MYDNKAWVFGGLVTNTFNNMYCLEFGNNGMLETMTWKKVEYANSAPSPRQYHTANVYNDKMYILGGKGPKACNDMYCFDFGTSGE